MTVVAQMAESGEEKRCSNCRHCIDIRWSEKITCLAFLEVRHPISSGECAEFALRTAKQTLRPMPCAA